MLKKFKKFEDVKNFLKNYYGNEVEIYWNGHDYYLPTGERKEGFYITRYSVWVENKYVGGFEYDSRFNEYYLSFK